MKVAPKGLESVTRVGPLRRCWIVWKRNGFAENEGPEVCGTWPVRLKAPGAVSSPTTREMALRACLKNAPTEEPLDLGGGGGRGIHDGMWSDRLPPPGGWPGGLCSARPAWVLRPEDMVCMTDRNCRCSSMREVVVGERGAEAACSFMYCAGPFLPAERATWGRGGATALSGAGATMPALPQVAVLYRLSRRLSCAVSSRVL